MKNRELIKLLLDSDLDAKVIFNFYGNSFNVCGVDSNNHEESGTIALYGNPQHNMSINYKQDVGNERQD